MKNVALILIMAFPSFGITKSWTPAEVDQVFNVLYHEGAITAAELVESYGVTPYDFGMDLLPIDKSKSLAWFSAQFQVTSDPQFLFGKAWLEMETNDLLTAMQTANKLLSQTEGLAKARAHYLLGVIYFKGGGNGYARSELMAAMDLYQELEKLGGVRLCQLLLSPQKHVVIIDYDPPRDDDDS